ncbi:methionyl-tRNA formyltransferase [Spiroplasma chrysopicola]|uniref:Methionyl-tRNA formyltransferase n=1 Tax=Spiroplasma chrysopicola DF-1 TaxID=1276227 RepID=R4U1R9_9MOLU|nr:methionyl-tRNA formyltransferase [Spiroplasma chrysopicola]AGM25267.1 methionyl-tRNA formyltransferase [Spiroplasma chrysopicola DF-1]
MKKKIIFMGTPTFALGVLQGLQTLGSELSLIAIITQPDRKIGRKQEIQFSPVKQFALKHDIPVYQPEKIGDLTETITNLAPDILLTCAYGQFIPEKILAIPKINALNIHASLLPKLRGGAPIHKAIIDGETETGVSLMQMIKKMDAGVVYYQEKIAISLTDTASSLHDKLMVLGEKIIAEQLLKVINGELIGVLQDERKVTFGYNISRSEEQINWNKPTLTIYNQIRGLYSWPIAYTTLQGINYKIYHSMMSSEPLNPADSKVAPGIIMAIEKTGIKVKTADGYLIITELQRAGKKPQLAEKYYYNINENKELQIGYQFQ